MTTNAELKTAPFEVKVFDPTTHNQVGTTMATYLKDSSGQYVIDPKSGLPYEVPVGYDPQNTVNRYAPLRTILGDEAWRSFYIVGLEKA